MRVFWFFTKLVSTIEIPTFKIQLTLRVSDLNGQYADDSARTSLITPQIIRKMQTVENNDWSSAICVIVSYTLSDMIPSHKWMHQKMKDFKSSLLTRSSN